VEDSDIAMDGGMSGNPELEVCCLCLKIKHVVISSSLLATI